MESEFFGHDLLILPLDKSKAKRIASLLSEIIPVLEQTPDKKNLSRAASFVISSCFLHSESKGLAQCWKIVLTEINSFYFFEEDGAVANVVGKILESYRIKPEDILPMLARLRSCVKEECPERALIFHGYPSSNGLHQTWTSSADRLGIGNLSAYTLTLQACPENLCFLLTGARFCPNMSANSFFENRELARTFPSELWNLKEIIHSQNTEASHLISEIVRAYESNEDREFEESRKLLVRLTISMFGEDSIKEYNPLFLNKDSLDRIHKGATYSLIDTIKKIDANYNLPLSLPTFFTDQSDPTLAHALSYIDKEPDLKKAGQYLKVAIDNISSHLIGSFRDGNCNFNLALLEAAYWCETRASQFLSRFQTFESQQQMLLDPCFKSIFRFNELSASVGKWSKSEFDLFWGKIRKSSGFEARSRLLGFRILERMLRLDGHFREQGRKNWLGALWSLNLSAKILQFVSVPLPSDCRVGERITRGLFIPPWLFPNWLSSD